MTDDDLCYMPAGQVLKLFRARKLSPVELLNAQITRSEVVNPAINCFTDRYFEEALGQAKAAEGKRPHLLVLPKRLLPSRRPVSVKR